MTREEKAVVIQELTEKFQESKNFYITDASGLTVAEVNDLRGKCYEKGVEYRVVKNTLIRKALESVDADFSSLDNEVLKGFSGIMFAQENVNDPAKIINGQWDACCMRYGKKMQDCIG